jgi:hypothetical protein
MIWRTISVLIALLPLLGAGCSGAGGGGGSGQTAQEAVLYEVADMLRGATRPDGRGPAGLADLKGSQSIFPHGYQAVKSGDVVVLWAAGVKGEGEAAKGGDIVAYEKDAPANGGYVVLTSGEVKKMSASEFQSAPKAK